MNTLADFPFDPPAVSTLAISGAQRQRFPVGRIFCVGRNYAAHAREMGADERDPPFFFMKPANAAIDASNAVNLPYPPMTSELHHEVELVLAISKPGSNIPVTSALDHVFGYGIGLDMTRRDLQAIAKDKRRPWEFAKSFANSAPVSAIACASDIGHPDSGSIELQVNGEPRQRSDLSRMIWSVAECISELSRFDALLPGDLIMTGTPEGVDTVAPGDRMRGQIAGVGEIDVTIA